MFILSHPCRHDNRYTSKNQMRTLIKDGHMLWPLCNMVHSPSITSSFRLLIFHMSFEPSITYSASYFLSLHFLSSHLYPHSRLHSVLCVCVCVIHSPLAPVATQILSTVALGRSQQMASKRQCNVISHLPSFTSLLLETWNLVRLYE